MNPAFHADAASCIGGCVCALLWLMDRVFLPQLRCLANFKLPGSGLLWWGERLSSRSLAKADPREPELMEFAVKNGSPVVSPHQFSSN
jgi:hypothetical protein